MYQRGSNDGLRYEDVEVTSVRAKDIVRLTLALKF